MDVCGWLRTLGLEQYESAFRENKIDRDILPKLTAEDLKDLGVVSVGDRRRLLEAIASLGSSLAIELEMAAESSTARPADVGYPHRAGERRYLTVLFCDLVGSTEIAGRLDAEEWRDIVAEYHRSVAQAVTRFGGHVAKNLGDGALIYFGYPLAQENDGERAVRGGLAILDAVSVQSSAVVAGGGPKLAVRVGIHAGSVVIGDDAEVFGEVPNIAARVQTAAEPGMLLITRDVHRLVSGLFVVNELGARTMKGVAEPVALLQVIRASGAKRHRAGRAVTPLVGREEELRQLENCWRRAREGQGRLVLLMGEPGIGKSRLIEEFQSRIAEVPHTWAELVCSQLLQNTPFHPFIEFARRRLEEPETTPERRVAALATWHRAVGLDPMQSVPLVAPLLELPVPVDYPPPPDAPDERRRRLIATLAGWFTGGARTQAVLLVIEDVHWIDPSTLDFLRVLAEQGAAVPLMILVTARPEFRESWPHRAHHTVITLAPLERGEVLRMVAEVASRHALSGEVVEALVNRTGGVPLFVEELTKFLLEGGARSGMQQIPLTLQASLAARLDRMGSAKETAQIGAVLGREFVYPLIRAVAGQSDTILSTALERLSEADLIHAQGLPPDASYRFKHALVRDAAYETLLKRRRLELHRAAARVLNDEFKDIAEAQPELLAHHLTEAGETEAAIAAWQRAGEGALRRAAYIEATEHLGKAIALAEALPEGPAQRQLRLQLQIAHGNALIQSRGYGAPETTTAFARAAELAAGIEDPATRFPARYGLWVGSLVRGEPHPIRTLSAEFLRDAEGQPGSAEVLIGHRIVGASHWYEGDYVGARAHLEQALASFDPERHRPLAFRYGQDIGVAGMIFLALTLWPLSEIARARRVAEDAVAYAPNTKHLATVAYALTHICLLELLCRDSAKLSVHAESLDAVSHELGLRFWFGYATFARGYTRCRMGDLGSGATEMRNGMETLREQGIAWCVPLLQVAYAEVEAEMGRIESAVAMVDNAIAFSKRTGQRWIEADLHRVRGEILLHAALPDFTAAEAALGRAIEIARNQRTKTFELRAALSLARLCHATLRETAARAVLAPALEGFSPTPEFPEIEQAQTLLATLKK